MNSNNNNIIAPITRTKKEAQISYNHMSGWYDLFSSFEKKYRELGIDSLCPDNGNKILEIGIGTGKSILKIMNKYSHQQITIFGIDLAERMCQKAKKKVMKKALASSVFIACAEATNLPFKENSIDRIFMCFTLELFSQEDILRVLGECHRVLKRGASIGVVVLSRRKVNKMVKIYEWFHHKFPKQIDCRPILVEKDLIKSNFIIKCSLKKKMWGLPVDIILAEK